MNRQFNEFWGNYFTSAAQGQKQLEEMSAWMKKGFSGTDELTTLFKRCYGLDGMETDDPMGSKKWQKAISEFQENFSDIAGAWGWVSQTEHQQLLEKCATLEERLQQQQDTITQLRSLLDQEGLGHTELFQHLKNVFEDQSDQFQKLMKGINKAGNKKS